jgi:hypothetical protein
LPNFVLKPTRKKPPPSRAAKSVKDFKVTALAHHPFVLKTADEVPFFFYDRKAHLFGGAPFAKKAPSKKN